MSDADADAGQRAPGEQGEGSARSRIATYLVGLGMAAVLTGLSFWVSSTTTFWGPGVPIGLCVLAVAQMGVHLVFFLHISTGPDNTNNVMAVAFGLLIVLLLGAGTLWIMSNLNANMMPMEQQMQMQR